MQARFILLLSFIIRNKKLLPDFILPAIALLLFFLFTLKDYFLFSSSTLFGIIVLPFVIHIRNPEEKSKRYFFVMVFFLLFSYLSPLNTFIYFAWISAFLLLIENYFGKTGIFSFFYLIVISPVFTYFGNFFGIPARLILTELAGNILNSIDFENQVAGNLIITPNSEFSVDPACMGLNMLNLSFMLALLIAIHYEKQTGKRLTIFFSGCYLSIVFFFNLIGNLIRIILLVLFHIPAENPMHDLVGIACLIAYVLVPLWFASRFFYAKFARAEKISSSVPFRFSRMLMLSAIAILTVTGFFIKNKINDTSHLPSVCYIEGYKKSMAAKDVLRFENENTLIYVKPVNSFYGAEHTPMVCWVGSGYSFKQVKKIIINNKELFMGKLTKGNDTIFCSWWFDNGTDKTINQLEWRGKVFAGAEPYSLINVNATNEKILYSKTAEIISKNIFKEN